MSGSRQKLARRVMSIAVGLGLVAAGAVGSSVSAADPTTGTGPGVRPAVGVEPIQWELVGSEAFVRGWLFLDEGVDPANHVVELYPYATGGAVLASTATDSYGNFTLPVPTDTPGSFVYEIRVVGDAIVPPMTSGPVVIEVFTAWTTIDVEPVPTAVVGDQVLISGRVLADGLRVADHVVLVERHGSDGTVLIGQAGTDSTGSFEIVDVPSVADWYVYVVRYEFGQGGTFFSSSSGYVDVEVSATEPAFLSVQAPATAVVGRSLTVSGRLSDHAGAPIVGREITVAGAGTAVTGADGAYAVNHVPSIVGPTKYAASFAGDAEFSGVRGVTATVNVIAVPTATSLTAPATAMVGTPINLDGTVLDDLGAPVGGGSVIIRRVNANGSTTTLATVTSDTAGRFSLAATAPATGAWTYTAAYLGDAARAPSAAAATVTVTLVPTATTITVPAATVGAPFTIRGTVSDALGRVVAGGSVRVQRSDASGTVTLGTVTTSANGAYSLATTAAAAGPATFTAIYLGDTTRAQSQAASTVEITRVPTTVSVTATKITKGRDKGSYTLVATLGSSLAGKTVTLSAAPVGGTETVIATGASTLTVVYKPSAPTVITARFAGDGTYAPSAAYVTIAP